MEYNEIPNKELKLTFHLLNFLQNSENLSADEKHIFDVLNDFFPEVADEKKTIFEYANSLKWIKVPELSNNRGGRTILPIDSSRIHHNIRITDSGKKELAKLLPFAEDWLLKKERSEETENLQNHFLKSQIKSINFAQKTTEETIKIAKSAKCAAWASAIGAIITALATLIALIFK